MRVSVYLLRHQGERLPHDQVRAATPFTGYLRVTREPGKALGQWSRMAILLAEEGSADVLLQLHEVQLQQWDSRGVVLRGIEIQWVRKGRFSYTQSWFVVFHLAPDHVRGPRRSTPASTSSPRQGASRPVTEASAD